MFKRIAFPALIVIAASSPTAARAQPQTDGHGATQPGLPKVIPWLELGPGREAVDRAAHGLLVWRLITDTAIVSIGPEDIRTLGRFHERYPDLHLVPGLKTSGILTDRGFDALDGWQRIARLVQTLMAVTGENTVVLEHESALKAYLDGQYPMNWDRLRAGLRLLPRPCNVWWYPSAGMDGVILDRYIRLCEVVVAELPDVRFIDHASFHAPRFTGQPGTLNAVRRLETAARRPPLRLIYCCGPEYWPFERVPEALRQVGEGEAIVYPGATRWVEAAQALARLLPARPVSGTQPADRR